MSEINEIGVAVVGNILSKMVLNGVSFSSSFLKNTKENTDKYYDSYFVTGLYKTVLDEYIDSHKGNFSDVNLENRVYCSISLKNSVASRSTVIFYRRKGEDKLFANNLGTLLKDVQSHRIFLVFDASVVDIDSIMMLDLDLRFINGQAMIADRSVRQSGSDFHLYMETDAIEHNVDGIVSDAFDNGHRDYYMVSMTNSIAVIFDND